MLLVITTYFIIKGNVVFMLSIQIYFVLFKQNED